MDEIKQITAEEFLINKNICNPKGDVFRLNLSRDCHVKTEKDIQLAMIEFAKMHVQAALKAKIEAMEEHMDDGYSLGEIDSFTYNAYPLDNIK